MPSPIYGVTDQGTSKPVKLNRRGEIRIDTGWVIVMVALQVIEIVILGALLALGLTGF